MISKSKYRYAAALLCVLVLAFFLLPIASAVTVTGASGVEVTVDSNGSISESGGTVTATVKGSWTTRKTTTITVTNTSGSTATISFNYSVSSHDSSVSTIDDLAGADSGSYSVLLTAGATKTFTMCSKRFTSSTTATATLSNFSVVVASESSNVTMSYNSELGSVTVAGATAASGSVHEVDSTNGAALVATPKSGATFLGWVDGNHKLRSTSASYTLIPTSDMTVQAVFVNSSSNAWFLVDNAYLTDDLNNASETLGTNIVLMNNGTLVAGTYTIQPGDTLLIPFDANNTVYTTEPAYVDAYTQPVAYRTLTMADGAKLVINGAMSISAEHKVGEGSYPEGGVPVGNVGFVQMNSGSSITINNGGVLYAWGYITGCGTVTAKSGGTVYENFQVMDFRGGTQTTGMKNNVFVLSQYYVQNIEVPLTLEAGAKEYAFTSLKMSLATISRSVSFIGPSGSDAMFILSNGSITKHYDGSTDRLIIEVSGDLSISKVDISYSGLISYTVSTEGNVLDLNGNISIILSSGTTTINQDFALQPGAHITIGEDASLVVPSGYSLYVYDSEQWGTYVHSGNTNDTTIRPLVYAPSRTYNRPTSLTELVDASIMVKGTLDASAGKIYTTESRALIEGTEGGKVITTAGTQEVTYQISDQQSSASDTVYANIPITPARLKNEDGSYTDTSDAATETTYNYINGFWHKGTCADNAGAAATCTTAQTCTVCGAQITAPLGHSYDSGTVTTAPTCEGTGVKTFTCSVCGVTKTEDVSATGHNYSSEETTAATCTTAGVRTYTCVNNVSHTYTETIAATGHKDDNSDNVCDVCEEQLVYYSVTITWSELNYVYTPTYTWNTSTLSYEVTGGTWSTGGNVTIQNDSNVSVWYNITTAVADNLGWTPTISVAAPKGEIAKETSLDCAVTVGGIPYANGKMILGTTATEIGTITISLSKEEIP